MLLRAAVHFARPRLLLDNMPVESHAVLLSQREQSACSDQHVFPAGAARQQSVTSRLRHVWMRFGSI